MFTEVVVLKTIVIGVRIPENLKDDLDRAKEIVGALSYSDLFRMAIREYLKQLSLLSERKQRISEAM